ncbi:MAG: ribonuclease H-like domain-containing protein [Thermoplasmatota archaeon]
METVPSLYEYEKQKWDLIEENKNRCLEEILDGKEKSNPKGSYLKISSSNNLCNLKIDRNKSLEELHSDFQLIKGVGPKTEKKLKEKGLSSFHDMREEGLYEKYVKEIIDDIENYNIGSLQDRIQRWHSLGHPLNYHLLALIDIESVLFFDIETLGLNNCPVFLIGAGFYDGKQFKVDQFLARDFDEEEAIIEGFYERLDEFDHLASFNGRRFDCRFIKDRCRYYDITKKLDMPHFDLLHMAKDRWSNAPNHKLITLEKYIFGEAREGDVPSSLIPNYYKTFIKKNNPGPLIPIIKHNKLDIITLFRMLNKF